MLGISPLQKRSLLLFFQQYGQVLSDVFLSTRRLFRKKWKDAKPHSHRESYREEELLFNPSLLLLPEPAHVLATSQASLLCWDTHLRKLAFSEEIWWSWTHPAVVSHSCTPVPSSCHPIILHSIPLSPHHPSACAGLYFLGASFLLSPRIKIWRAIQKKNKISLFMLCFTEN